MKNLEYDIAYEKGGLIFVNRSQNLLLALLSNYCTTPVGTTVNDMHMYAIR